MKAIYLKIQLILLTFSFNLSCQNSISKDATATLTNVNQAVDTTDIHSELLKAFLFINLHKLEIDEQPNTEVNKNLIDSKVRTKEKFLVRQNQNAANLLVEKTVFNQNGDTSIYILTNENEMSWKDEVYFRYDASGKLYRKDVFNYYDPRFVNRIIEADSTLLNPPTISHFNFFYDKNKVAIEFQNSFNKIVSSKIFEYSNGLIVKFQYIYKPSSDTTSKEYLYNDKKKVISVSSTNSSSPTIKKVFYYDDSTRLNTIEYDSTSVYIKYMRDSIEVIKKVGKNEFSVLYIFASTKLIGKKIIYSGKLFSEEEYEFNELGLLKKLTISQVYPQELKKSYLFQYTYF